MFGVSDLLFERFRLDMISSGLNIFIEASYCILSYDLYFDTDHIYLLALQVFRAKRW